MDEHARLQRAAKDHLWMHFTRHGAYADSDVPVMVKGEGAYLYDSQAKPSRYRLPWES